MERVCGRWKGRLHWNKCRRAKKKIIDGRDDISFQEVVYNTRSQGGRVRAVADELIHQLHDHKDENENFDDYFNKTFSKLFDVAAICKNKFFDEEVEYRLIYRVTEANIMTRLECPEENYRDKDTINKYSEFKAFHFIVNDNKVSSYIDLCFKEALDNNVQLIKSIMTGPKCEVSKNEVGALLVQNGFRSIDIDLNQPIGSYR